MADKKPAARTATDAAAPKEYTVTNGGRGPRYVNDHRGRQVSIPAGGQAPVTLTDAEVRSIARHPDLTTSTTKAQAAKALEQAAPEGGEGGEGEGGDDTTVVSVEHAAFGKYYGLNAAGQQVAGVGPFDKAAAQEYATQNKVEFKAAAAS
jgi:hypothetical protein